MERLRLVRPKVKIAYESKQYSLGRSMGDKMKLYIKLFNRRFDVSTSNGNVRRVYEMQLRIAKVQAEKDI